MHVDLDR
jgi:hypothetical protein